MPGATQTMPSWMTSSTTKDIPLNGISNGTKLIKTSSRHTASSGAGNGILPGDSLAAESIAPANKLSGQETSELVPTKERVKYDGDKEKYETAWSKAGSAIGTVFDDLFREVAGVDPDAFLKLTVLVNNLSIQIGASDYNVGIRSWNASLLDRQTTLKPLRDQFGQEIGGLAVTIEELEALPDVYKAGLLLKLGFDPSIIHFPPLYSDDGDVLDVAVKDLNNFLLNSGIMTAENERTDEEKEVLDAARRDQPKDEMTARYKFETRLTKQLRAAVGLPAVAVP